MPTIDLSLPFAGVLVLVAGLVGWHTRAAELRGPDCDQTADLQAFEARFFHRNPQLS
jgi:hypothetical protein